MTRNAYTARSCHLYRGTYPFHYPLPHPDNTSKWQEDVDNRIKFGLTEALKLHIIRKGDTVIAIQGWRGGKGYTNSLRVVVRCASTNKRLCLRIPRGTSWKTPPPLFRTVGLGFDFVQEHDVERFAQLRGCRLQLAEVGRAVVGGEGSSVFVLLKHHNLDLVAVLAAHTVLGKWGDLRSWYRARPTT